MRATTPETVRATRYLWLLRLYDARRFRPLAEPSEKPRKRPSEARSRGARCAPPKRSVRRLFEHAWHHVALGGRRRPHARASTLKCRSRRTSAPTCSSIHPQMSPFAHRDHHMLEHPPSNVALGGRRRPHARASTLKCRPSRTATTTCSSIHPQMSPSAVCPDRSCASMRATTPETVRAHRKPASNVWLPTSKILRNVLAPRRGAPRR